ncbi:hypothetical protein, partial [Saccharothrix deserti]|uniref:hypothetical protein n=1 Tax=Saccharothrix deserti TaxID=2593674 RepID=UPI001EE4B6AE
MLQVSSPPAVLWVKGKGVDHDTEAVKDQGVAFDLGARWSGMAITREVLSQLGCRFAALLPHLNE